MFTVYTVRVIHTFCASPNLTAPSHQRFSATPPALFTIFNITNPILFGWMKESERRVGGSGRWKPVEWDCCSYTDMKQRNTEEKSWKRFSWYDEVNYFIFSFSFSPLFLLYCCLLPQLMLELVMLWCFVCFGWGFSPLLRPRLLVPLLLYKFIQFLLHSGITNGSRRAGRGGGEEIFLSFSG